MNLPNDSTADIGGGRRLGYREYGDPGGTPIVNCHGGLLNGLDVAGYADAARQHGARIISPDRPGLGASTSSPDRTTGAWAADVGALLDALHVETAAVLGWSMGGQYALAVAAGLRDRVTRVAVIAGALPLDDESTFAQLNHMDRRLTRLSQHHPHVAADVFRALGEVARHTPNVWGHLTARAAVPTEATALEALPDPWIASAAAAALAHGHGMVEEYQAWVRPWGFGAGDVVRPTTIWQGDADDLVPPEWGTRLAGLIAGASLRLLPGEGHFLGFAHQADIIGDLVAD